MDRKHAFVVGLSLLLLAMGAGLAMAQDTGRIEGRVSRDDGAGLDGVTVRIDQLDQVVVTGDGGAFTFEGVPAGSYDLTFNLVDRTADEKGVEVAAGATRTVDKVVDWDVSFAETITVTSVSRRTERITEAPACCSGCSRRGLSRRINWR